MVQLAQMEEQHPRFEHGGVRNDPLELLLTLLLQSGCSNAHTRVMTAFS